MKQTNKNKYFTESKNYINGMISKLEKDLLKHCDLLVDKKSRKLTQELRKDFRILLKQGAKHLFQPEKNNFLSERQQSGFSLSPSQLLNSITHEIKKNLFSG